MKNVLMYLHISFTYKNSTKLIIFGLLGVILNIPYYEYDDMINTRRYELWQTFLNIIYTTAKCQD